MILDIPAHLPACQFAFESARENFSNSMPVFKNQHLRDKSLTSKNMKYSALLPRGEAAVQGWKNLWQKGYETFKLKIAVDDITQELEILHLLVRQLPESAKIRLDANGGLNYQQAKLWLEVCDQFSQKIEFIEQPLGIDRLEEMLELSQVYLTEIALDESVATWQKLESCYQMGWRGVFVVKPAILGSPSRLRGFCQNHTIDLVFSSVFETPIGREAALKLAGELSHGISNLSGNCRSLGFGIDHYFALQSTNWPEVLWNPIY
jgi:O-succinylbenzoate synthase